jgi:hypothetical protein
MVYDSYMVNNDDSLVIMDWESTLWWFVTVCELEAMAIDFVDLAS